MMQVWNVVALTSASQEVSHGRTSVNMSFDIQFRPME